MAPACHSFAASELPLQVQLDVHGRKRKLAGGRDVDLRQCELLSAVQYHCAVERSEQRDSPIRCWPVKRLFRRCQDNKGSFTVETTMWETADTVAQSSTGDADG